MALAGLWFVAAGLTVFAIRPLGRFARFASAAIPIPPDGFLAMRMLGWCACWLRVIPPVVFHEGYCAELMLSGQRGNKEC